MCWLKRDMWKIGIAITGSLLLLVLVVWVPVLAVGAQERTSGLALLITGTVQATPTVDATVTALNKEKLAQEVQQLKNQNTGDLFGWLQTNVSILLSTLVVVIGGLIGLFRWLGDRRNEQEKRAEERFQSAVMGLGDEKEGARVGAAIMLRTFLNPDYTQFYSQVFDLAVAHLRLPRTPHPPDHPDGISHPPDTPDTPLHLTTLCQALIVVFKEAFPRARDNIASNKVGVVQPLDTSDDFEMIARHMGEAVQSLDATGVQLDNAYLALADLKHVWMRNAFLRNADLRIADLRGALLSEANLSGADLRKADLSEAILRKTNLSGADLREAILSEAILKGAKFIGADLRGANLGFADLSKTNLEEALYLKDTDLHGVRGLTKEQLEACKAKGALIDQVSTVIPSQSPASLPPPS